MSESKGWLGAISEKFTGSEIMQGRSFRYVIYGLGVVIVVGVVLIVVDNFFPFLPVNPIGGPSEAARAVKNFWPTEGDNLIVPASESPTVSATNYSMSVSLVVADSRTPSIGKFRHIVHRGSNPCGITMQSAGTAKEDTPAGTEDSYNQTGLPSVMNPGLFLDKYKNDMHVFIHTKGKEGNMDVLWLESLTIEDVPLRVPITIGIICTGKTIEVYMNCRLYSTLLLKGTPYLPKADNQWFGRYCSYPVSGLVKHLQLWDSPLGSSDYLMLCRSASFSSVPDACPTAN